MLELPGLPARPVDRAGRLLRGRWAGELTLDPVAVGPRHGRVRRWCYVGAGDAQAAVGAAVVEVGAVVVAFAWACLEGVTHTWQVRRARAPGTAVAPTPGDGAALRTRGASVTLGGAGELLLDVPVAAGRLEARVAVTRPVTGAVLATPTPRGGWNVTQKAAGHAVTGQLAVGGGPAHELRDAGGWRDWTAGRQDRVTTWRWAAGAGSDDAGRRVGCNVSTGMNGAGPGEDLVWWQGRPHGIEVDTLAPAGRRTAGPWRVEGPDWGLALTDWGVRAADEDLLLVRSRYVQPVGRFTGSLPGPDGTPVAVSLTGVTEDHFARW